MVAGREAGRGHATLRFLPRVRTVLSLPTIYWHGVSSEPPQRARHSFFNILFIIKFLRSK